MEYTHLFITLPLISFALDCAGLDLPLDLAMLEDSYRSDLREMEFTIFDLKTCLRVCETIIPILTLKSRVSHLLITIFHASEKVLECLIESAKDILRNL